VSVIHLNVLEKNILAILGIDARVSNRQIASTLNVTEGTIRTHIRRLQNEGLIHFTAISDLKLVGSPNLVMLGICADIAQVPALAKTLAAFPNLSCVMVLLGRYNLLAMGLFTSIEAVSKLIQSSFENCRAFVRWKPRSRFVTSNMTSVLLALSARKPKGLNWIRSLTLVDSARLWRRATRTDFAGCRFSAVSSAVHLA
jgi:Lrp/AsnC family transcriptional regulator for asnA, asnC and gidA